MIKLHVVVGLLMCEVFAGCAHDFSVYLKSEKTGLFYGPFVTERTPDIGEMWLRQETYGIIDAEYLDRSLVARQRYLSGPGYEIVVKRASFAEVVQGLQTAMDEDPNGVRVRINTDQVLDKNLRERYSGVFYTQRLGEQIAGLADMLGLECKFLGDTAYMCEPGSVLPQESGALPVASVCEGLGSPDALVPPPRAVKGRRLEITGGAFGARH